MMTSGSDHALGDALDLAFPMQWELELPKTRPSTWNHPGQSSPTFNSFRDAIRETPPATPCLPPPPNLNTNREHELVARISALEQDLEQSCAALQDAQLKAESFRLKLSKAESRAAEFAQELQRERECIALQLEELQAYKESEKIRQDGDWKKERSDFESEREAHELERKEWDRQRKAWEGEREEMLQREQEWHDDRVRWEVEVERERMEARVLLLESEVRLSLALSLSLSLSPSPILSLP